MVGVVVEGRLLCRLSSFVSLDKFGWLEVALRGLCLFSLVCRGEQDGLWGSWAYGWDEGMYQVCWRARY